MKSPKLASVMLGTTFAVLFTSSCKKNKTIDSPTPAGKACKIASATLTSASSSVTYTLKYDDSDRILSVAYNGSDAYTKHFSYSGKLIFVYTDAAVNSSTDTITLNSEGSISNIKETVPNAVYNYVYTYDANGVLIKSSTQQDNYPPVTLNYMFNNGDLLYTSGSDGSKDTLSYYNDKPAVVGDPDQFQQLSYFGAYYYKNKHLKKSEDSDPYHFTYSYSFDSDGKITSVISNYGTTTDTLSFNYTCP
jgi:hypothetical protein